MLHAILINTNNPAKAFRLAQSLTQNDLSPQPDVLIIEAKPSAKVLPMEAA